MFLGLVTLGLFARLTVASGIILLMGVLPALVAPVPAIAVWAYNRRSAQET